QEKICIEILLSPLQSSLDTVLKKRVIIFRHHSKVRFVELPTIATQTVFKPMIFVYFYMISLSIVFSFPEKVSFSIVFKVLKAFCSFNFLLRFFLYFFSLLFWVLSRRSFPLDR